MRDKLLCGTSGTTGLAHIPFVSLLDELLTVGIQPLSLPATGRSPYTAPYPARKT